MIKEQDLAELCDTNFMGLIVGVGSLVLRFSSGANIIVQCPFDCIDGKNISRGHGEEVDTSPLLFSYLNKTSKHAEFCDNKVLTITFDINRLIRIIPEHNGLESYVLSTRFGICPVIAT